MITLGYIAPACLRMLNKKTEQEEEEEEGGVAMETSDLQELNELIHATLKTLGGHGRDKRREGQVE